MLKIRNLVLISLAGLILSGCGMDELPKMKTEAEKSLKEFNLENRFYADSVYQFANMLAKTPQLQDSSQKVLKSRASLLSIMLNTKTSEKDVNRFRSFQNFLSRDLNQLTKEAEKVQFLKEDVQFRKLMQQISRQQKKVTMKKRGYLMQAEAFNSKKTKFPHSLYNKFKHHLDPLPVIGDLPN